MYVVSLVSRLPMQIVGETVTYGWPQGTSPYLVVTIYSRCPPCLNFAVYTGYMLPHRLCRLDALLMVCITNTTSYNKRPCYITSHPTYILHGPHGNSDVNDMINVIC